MRAALISRRHAAGEAVRTRRSPRRTRRSAALMHAATGLSHRDDARPAHAAGSDPEAACCGAGARRYAETATAAIPGPACPEAACRSRHPSQWIQLAALDAAVDHLPGGIARAMTTSDVGRLFALNFALLQSANSGPATLPRFAPAGLGRPDAIRAELNRRGPARISSVVADLLVDPTSQIAESVWPRPSCWQMDRLKARARKGRPSKVRFPAWILARKLGIDAKARALASPRSGRGPSTDPPEEFAAEPARKDPQTKIITGFVRANPRSLRSRTGSVFPAWS